MATNLDFARELAAAADRDLLVLSKLAPDPDMPIEKVGFESQQAVEKYLKAVLAAYDIEFHRVHDIKTLVDAASDAGLTVPNGEGLEALTPFAVEFRYHALSLGSSTIRRENMTELVETVRDWARKLIDEVAATANGGSL